VAFKDNPHVHFRGGGGGGGGASPRRRLVGGGDLPPAAVTEQSRDVVSMLRAAGVAAAQHVLLVEDDFMLCPNGLLALYYFLRKATATAAEWLALRVSYGLNGVIVKGADAAALAAHIEKEARRLPPDHAFASWIAGSDDTTQLDPSRRPYFAFRHNLFFHVGGTSALAHEWQGKWIPRCYDQLYDWLQASLAPARPLAFLLDRHPPPSDPPPPPQHTHSPAYAQPAEVFRLEQCGHDDIWPCPGRKSNEGGGFRAGAKGVAADKLHIVDWTAARLCDRCKGGLPLCGNPLGAMTERSVVVPAVASDPAAAALCKSMALQHAVVVGSSWGTLPDVLQLKWKLTGCDDLV